MVDMETVADELQENIGYHHEDAMTLVGETIFTTDFVRAGEPTVLARSIKQLRQGAALFTAGVQPATLTFGSYANGDCWHDSHRNDIRNEGVPLTSACLIAAVAEHSPWSLRRLERWRADPAIKIADQAIVIAARLMWEYEGKGLAASVLDEWMRPSPPEELGFPSLREACAGILNGAAALLQEMDTGWEDPDCAEDMIGRAYSWGWSLAENSADEDAATTAGAG